MDKELGKTLLDTERQSDEKPIPGLNRLCAAGDLVGPIVAVTLALPCLISCVGVSIAGVDALKPGFSQLLSVGLLSSAFGSLAYARYSQFPTSVTVSFLTATYLGRLALLMENKLPSHLLLTHMMISQALFTLLLGCLAWAIASMGVLWVTRFLPYPVVSGFNCAGALMITNGGLSLGTGKNIVQFVTHLGSVFFSAQSVPAWSDEYIHLVATLLCVSVFGMLRRLGIAGAAKVPVGFVMISSCFFGLTALCGISNAELAGRGFLLENVSKDAWYAGFFEIATNASQIHWKLWLESDVLLLSLPYACLITVSNLLFLASMHEVLPPDVSEKYVFEKEVRMMGKIHVLTSLICGSPVSHSINFWLIIKQAGSYSRIWVVSFGMTMMALFFCPDLRLCLGLVPKCAFSGLVACTGFDYFWTCFLESRRRIAPAEWRFTAVTMVVTFFNVFAGILLGIVLTGASFLVEYSTMTGIVRQTTLREVRSFASRDPRCAALLDRRGHEVIVIWCSGYIFFGTASTIVEQIEGQLDSLQGVRAVLIDFEHVPAVDASGISALMRFSNHCLKKDVPVHVCFSGMTRRLRLAMQAAAQEWHSKDSVALVVQHRIEAALAWAEQLLIDAHRSEIQPVLGKQRCMTEILNIPQAETLSATQAIIFLCQACAPSASETEKLAFAADIAGTAEISEFQQGEVVMQEGHTASFLYVILSGSLVLSKGTSDEASLYKMNRYHLNEEKGDVFVFEERTQIELKTLHKGNWIGAMEFCAKGSRSRRPCCVVSAHAGEHDSRTLKLPFECLHRAIQAHPIVGIAVLSHISCVAGLQSLELLGSTRILPYRSGSDAIFLATVSAE